LIVFSIILIFFGRKRRSNDFDVGPSIEAPNRKSSDKNVKRYNFNGDVIEDRPIIAPVVIYSDSLNQEQQEAMGIEKHMLDEEAMPLRELGEGKRLSKYNFLSQAFSQMRTSYVDQPARSPSAASSQKELVIKKPKKYQMYSMYQDSGELAGPPKTPPPAVTTNSYIPGDPTRESTVTVGTLHAPLLLHNHRGTPSPGLPKQSPLKMVHRDSVVSEVSEYSTFPTSPIPPSTPTKYPFI
jgi:hypothetical protein